MPLTRCSGCGQLYRLFQEPKPKQGGCSLLVLSRKVGERLVIGENVTVEVVEVRGDKVRLGVVAPRDVEVDREEIRVSKCRALMPHEDHYRDLGGEGGAG